MRAAKGRERHDNQVVGGGDGMPSSAVFESVRPTDQVFEHGHDVAQHVLIVSPRLLWMRRLRYL